MNKKRVIVEIGLMLVIVSITVGIVSAGFWDIFKIGERGEDLEGELRESADVSITMANSPPTIDSWTEPDFDTSTAGIQAWPPTACSTTTVVTSGPSNRLGIDVTVSDPNGDTDLDGGTMTLTVSKTGEDTRTATCTPAAPTGTSNTLVFTCSVVMQYYDAGASNWVITVSFTDESGGTATNNGQTSGGTYPYFIYGSLSQIRIKDDNDPDYVTGDTPTTQDTLVWVDVAVDDTNILAGSPKGSGTGGGYITVQNCGNEAVTAPGSYSATGTYLQVLGRDLIDNSASFDDYMEPDTFAVDELAAACTAGQLLDNDAAATTTAANANVDEIAVLGAGLGVGTDAVPVQERSLYFCLEDINPNTPSCTNPAPLVCRGNDPIGAAGYSTQPSPNNWEINICTAPPCDCVISVCP